jgi:hypothetical protein
MDCWDLDVLHFDAFDFDAPRLCHRVDLSLYDLRHGFLLLEDFVERMLADAGAQRGQGHLNHGGVDALDFQDRRHGG